MEIDKTYQSHIENTALYEYILAFKYIHIVCSKNVNPVTNSNCICQHLLLDLTVNALHYIKMHIPHDIKMFLNVW